MVVGQSVVTAVVSTATACLLIVRLYAAHGHGTAVLTKAALEQGPRVNGPGVSGWVGVCCSCSDDTRDGDRG